MPGAPSTALTTWTSPTLARLRRLRVGRWQLAVAGLGLALVGQHLVAHRLDLRAGAGLLGLGAALFTLACWPASGGCEGATTAPPDSDGPATPGGLSRLSHFLTPAALNVFALVLFWRGVQPSLAWIAWAASLVAAGSVAWSLAGRPRPALWPTRELAAVLVLTALGAAFRLYRLDERSEEHTSELQSRENLVCRLLL